MPCAATLADKGSAARLVRAGSVQGVLAYVIEQLKGASFEKPYLRGTAPLADLRLFLRHLEELSNAGVAGQEGPGHGEVESRPERTQQDGEDLGQQLRHAPRRLVGGALMQVKCPPDALRAAPFAKHPPGTGQILKEPCGEAELVERLRGTAKLLLDVLAACQHVLELSRGQAIKLPSYCLLPEQPSLAPVERQAV